MHSASDYDGRQELCSFEPDEGFLALVSLLNEKFSIVLFCFLNVDVCKG